MMSKELAAIFIFFIFGLIFTFNSWRALTRNEINGRRGRYRRKDNPFEFWYHTSLSIFFAVLSIIIGIVFSISLLRSSWRTVKSSPRGHRIETQGMQVGHFSAHCSPLTHA